MIDYQYFKYNVGVL